MLRKWTKWTIFALFLVTEFYVCWVPGFVPLILLPLFLKDHHQPSPLVTHLPLSSLHQTGGNESSNLPAFSLPSAFACSPLHLKCLPTSIFFTRLTWVLFPKISLVYWFYHLLKCVQISPVLQAKHFHRVTESDKSSDNSTLSSKEKWRTSDLRLVT